MAAEEVLPGVYQVGNWYVNAFLIVHDEVTLIDTGLPKRADAVLKVLAAAGSEPSALEHIAITHHHVDHSGSLDSLITSTGARAYIHPLDAPIVRGERQVPGPNRSTIAGKVIGPLMERMSPRLEPVAELLEVGDSEEVPAAGGMTAIHTPGHTAGHLSYLWPQRGGVLFAGDAAGNFFGLGPPVGSIGSMFSEDIPAAKESFRKLAALEFDIACFGHGGVIKGKAHLAFRRKIEKLAR